MADDKSRKRLFIALFVGVIVLLLCGVCGAAIWQVAEIGSFMGSTFGGMADARREGLEIGQQGTWNDCVETAMVDIASCARQDSTEAQAECVSYGIRHQACMEVASGRDQYCAGVPPADPTSPADPWARAQCVPRAQQLSLEPQAARTFGAFCESLLRDMRRRCMNPGAYASPDAGAMPL